MRTLRMVIERLPGYIYMHVKQLSIMVYMYMGTNNVVNTAAGVLFACTRVE